MAEASDLIIRIVEVLVDHPLLESEASRRALVNAAGLDADIVRHVDFSGSAFQHTSNLVALLCDPKFARDSNRNHPLEAILSEVAIASGEPDRSRITELIELWHRHSGTNHQGLSIGLTRYLQYLRRRWLQYQSPLLPYGTALSDIAIDVEVVVNEESRSSPGNVASPLSIGRALSAADDLVVQFVQNGVTLLLGDPGGGKSVLLARVCANQGEK